MCEISQISTPLHFYEKKTCILLPELYKLFYSFSQKQQSLITRGNIMKKQWLYSSIAVSALMLGIAACSGDNGKDGADGADGVAGENGTSCTVQSLSDSSGYKIICGGDSVGVLLNGTDGDNGANGRYGNGCYVEELGDGSGYDVYCGDSKVGQLLNGTNGESCTVTSTDDGAKVTCGGVSTLIKSGSSCTAVSVEGGYELTCGGKTIGTILNGTNGTNGENGESGTSCVAEESETGNGFDLYCAGKFVGKISNGESCTIADNADGTITQTCGDDEVILYKAVCGTSSYDPTKYTCVDNSIMKYCFNSDNEIRGFYDTTSQYCNSAGEVVDLGTCGSAPDVVTYDTELYYCSEDNAVEKKKACGTDYYNPETEYCSKETTVEDLQSCEVDVATTTTVIIGSSSSSQDGFITEEKLYNPEESYCGTDDAEHKAILALKACGTELYNPEESYCNDAKKVVDIKTCGSSTYKEDYQYCEDDEVKDLLACGEEEEAVLYDPREKYCSAETKVKDLLRCGEEGSTGTLYNPELTICDTRDYNVYNYTKIGDQVWTSTDMRYSTGNVGRWYNTESSTSTENSDGARYYTWMQALGISMNYYNTLWNDNAEGEKIQGVCPNGWHIPSLTEVNVLRAYLGKTYEGCEDGEGKCGDALKEEGWGDGTDEYGFTATENGAGTYQGNSTFEWSKDGGFFMWTTAQTSDATIKDQATRFNISSTGAFTQTTDAKTTLYPVRCIKD